ncbi:hypothetical protein SFRURICE_008015 [Spodoptera frugiperda]|nr:hypothetical protein SFRURICE_008015 [Spodoptera frugiperda]
MTFTLGLNMRLISTLSSNMFRRRITIHGQFLLYKQGTSCKNQPAKVLVIVHAITTNRGISLIIMGLASYSKWRNKTSTRRPTSARTESRAEASLIMDIVVVYPAHYRTTVEQWLDTLVPRHCIGVGVQLHRKRGVQNLTLVDFYMKSLVYAEGIGRASKFFTET